MASRLPRLILVSPIPFENLSEIRALPDGVRENERLSAYADTIAAVASDMDVEFADVFSPMLSRYELTETPLTINGFSLTDDGYPGVRRPFSGPPFTARIPRR